MNPQIRLSIAAWLLAFASGGSSAVPAETDLKWKCEPGDRFTLKIRQDTSSETNVNDKKIAVAMGMGLELEWRVQEVADDGSVTMSQSFTRLTLKTTDPAGRIAEFDSQAATAPVASGEAAEPSAEFKTLSAAIRPLLRARVEVVMTSRGEIVAVRLPAETDSLLRGGESLARLKHLLTKDGLSRTLRQSLGLLPEKPVAVSAAWDSQTEIESPAGKISLTQHFVFDGPVAIDGDGRDHPAIPTDPPASTDPAAVQASNRRLQKISMTAKIEVENSDPLAPAGANPPPKLTGVYFFDAAGHLDHSRVTQTLSSDASLLDTLIRVRTTSVMQTHLRRQSAADSDPAP